MDEETIQSILQQELLKLKKDVMDALRKEMKEMIFNETMKSATPRIPLMKKNSTTLKSLTKTLESDIAKVRGDLKDLVDKLPDPKCPQEEERSEGRKRSVSSPEVPSHNKPLILNVGGQLFETRLETLRRYPGTLLGMMALGHPFFSFDNHRPKGEAGGQPFFDRNSMAFEHVLEFYRTGSLHRPPGLAAGLWKQELDYWNIPYRDTLPSGGEEGSSMGSSGGGEHDAQPQEKKKQPKKRRSQSALPRVDKELWFDEKRKKNSERSIRQEEGSTRGSKDDSTEWRALMSPRWENDKAITKLVAHKSQNNISAVINTDSSSSSRASTKEKKAKRRSMQNIFSSKVGT